ncbi:hypothetical protein I317_01527 [Kwoniella heveanensis CBS 569]|nr:hypothetical protein I317_01527 [Kwoniella heveanensis CBS 569]
MSLLSGSIQPPLLTLLSSTSTPSLSPLFTSVVDPSSSDALITSLPDTESATSTESSSSSRKVPHAQPKGCVSHHVMHIQSPDPRKTYIQAGNSVIEHGRWLDKGKGRDDVQLPLGVELPWLGMQVKRLGRRDMSFEVGVVDSRGREGVIRFSSFKKNPTVHPHRAPPLIHLPLQLPSAGPSQLTQWVHIPINLAALIPLFQHLPRPQRHASASESDDGDDDNDNNSNEEGGHKGEEGKDRRKRRKVAELPQGGFGTVSYVRVYANCRIRRIWFSAEGERTIEGMSKSVQDEWALYAADEAA